jgi:hypothetical protein
MTFLLPPGPMAPAAGWLPVQLLKENSPASNDLPAVMFVEDSTPPIVLTAIDATCTIEEPVHCFCRAFTNDDTTFFWDSQSTGEGLGVTFAWRGALYLPRGDYFTVELTTTGALIVMGICAFGWAAPEQTYTPLG